MVFLIYHRLFFKPDSLENYSGLNHKYTWLSLAAHGGVVETPIPLGQITNFWMVGQSFMIALITIANLRSIYIELLKTYKKYKYGRKSEEIGNIFNIL